MSPAAPRIERLRLAGVDVVVMTTREVGTACSTLQDAVAQGDVWHHGSPDMEDALRGAVRRDIGEGQWAFGRARSARADVEIDPIVGAANALWLADLVGRGYDLGASIY
jgi:phage terminase large subunit-like protein